MLGAYQALCRQIALGTVKMFPQTEMLDLVLVDGHAKGIITRNLCTGEIDAFAGDAVVLATGGYSNVFFLSTNARGCNVTATYRAYKRGALFGNPCFTQIHPTCIPVTGQHQSKLTLMSESLRNDGRVWVPKRDEDCAKPPNDIPDPDRDYYLEPKFASAKSAYRTYVAKLLRWIDWPDADARANDQSVRVESDTLDLSGMHEHNVHVVATVARGKPR